jgi:uncharacterized cupin superfamily protein
MDLPEQYSGAAAADGRSANGGGGRQATKSVRVQAWRYMRTSTETKSGTVRIADSTNLLVSKTIAATRVTIKPGGMRDMHWRPNADEWNYWIKGTRRVTVFNTGPAAITANFHPGDIGYVKKAFGHYVENTGTRISCTWRSSEQTGLRRCRCPIGWRTVQSTWLPRR